MSKRKTQLKLTYDNVEPISYNNVTYINNDTEINYSVRNKEYKPLTDALKISNIVIPDTVDAHSVLWTINELYLRLDKKKLLELMNYIEANSLEMFGKMTKGE